MKMDRADVLWRELGQAFERIKELEQDNERLKKEIESLKSGCAGKRA